MSRFLRHEPTPRPTDYAKAQDAIAASRKRDKRNRTIFVFLCPVLIASGWWACETFSKIFSK